MKGDWNEAILIFKGAEVTAMADDKDDGDEKTRTAGKGGSPASSTPHEEARASGDKKQAANSVTPKESKESTGGKGGGLH